jgi:hypothetical protein
MAARTRVDAILRATPIPPPDVLRLRAVLRGNGRRCVLSLRARVEGAVSVVQPAGVARRGRRTRPARGARGARLARLPARSGPGRRLADRDGRRVSRASLSHQRVGTAAPRFSRDPARWVCCWRCIWAP